MNKTLDPEMLGFVWTGGSYVLKYGDPVHYMELRPSTYINTHEYNLDDLYIVVIYDTASGDNISIADMVNRIHRYGREMGAEDLKQKIIQSLNTEI
jgi:hypothetical protein